MSKIEFAEDEVAGLVSVVIPAYKADRFLGQTLRSIAAQTYRDWEVIVVEDASQGETERIVAAFAAQHPQHRVLFLRNDVNRGPSHTRNVAFAQARGQFVALLDADDLWLEDHLEKAIATLKATGGDVAFSTVAMFDDETNKSLGEFGPNPQELVDFPTSFFGRNFVVPSASVMRRAVIATVGPWDTSLRFCEDFDFWLRCAMSGRRFEYVDGCHCRYRKGHAQAATRNACAIQESLARVAERYIRRAKRERKTIRRLVAKNYATAARMHREMPSADDPSADRYRAASLLFRSWLIRPQRLDRWFKATLETLSNCFRL